MTPEHNEQNEAIYHYIDNALAHKMDKPSTWQVTGFFGSVFVVIIGAVFGYGVLFNKVDTALSNRYTSTDAVRDIALIETRFNRNEEDIADLEDVDEQFRVRIRELEQRSVQ